MSKQKDTSMAVARWVGIAMTALALLVTAVLFVGSKASSAEVDKVQEKVDAHIEVANKKWTEIAGTLGEIKGYAKKAAEK